MNYRMYAVYEAISEVSIFNPHYKEVRMNITSIRCFLTGLGLTKANSACSWNKKKDIINFNNHGLKIKIFIDNKIPKETAVFIRDEKSLPITVELSG